MTFVDDKRDHYPYIQEIATNNTKKPLFHSEQAKCIPNDIFLRYWQYRRTLGQRDYTIRHHHGIGRHLCLVLFMYNLSLIPFRNQGVCCCTSSYLYYYYYYYYLRTLCSYIPCIYHILSSVYVSYIDK